LERRRSPAPPAADALLQATPAAAAGARPALRAGVGTLPARCLHLSQHGGRVAAPKNLGADGSIEPAAPPKCKARKAKWAASGTGQKTGTASC